MKRRLGLAIAAFAAAGVGMGWIVGYGEVVRWAAAPFDAANEVARHVPRARAGGMDLVFMVTADTHFGVAHTIARNRRAIDAMNTMEGRELPAGLGRLGRPRGVLAAGDLTENGEVGEWEAFVAHFGTDGTDGRLRFPVFETWGNHDKHSGWYVRQRIEERHGDVRYAFDWHDVHVVSLGEAPDHEDIAWLSDDLARVGPEVGLVLFFHFPLEGPFTDNWFVTEYKDALHAALEGHPVLGIFHGHHHASGSYRWRGIDVYNVGSPKHSFTSFAVVRITDQRMTVASWNYELGAWWWWHDKAVFGDQGPELRYLPPGMVGGR